MEHMYKWNIGILTASVSKESIRVNEQSPNTSLILILDLIYNSYKTGQVICTCIICNM